MNLVVSIFNMPVISFCTFQVKPGGRIPDKGKKIIVHIKNIRDLSRDVIKVYSLLPTR